MVHKVTLSVSKQNRQNKHKQIERNRKMNRIFSISLQFSNKCFRSIPNKNVNMIQVRNKAAAGKGKAGKGGKVKKVPKLA